MMPSCASRIEYHAMDIAGKATFTDHLIARYLSLGGWIYHSAHLLLTAFLIGWVTLVEWSGWVVALVSFVLFSHALAFPLFTWLKTKLDPRRTAHVEIELSDNGLVWKSEIEEKIVRWSEICKWRIGFKTILLFTDKDNFEVIPFHFFASSIEATEFGKILESKYGKCA